MAKNGASLNIVTESVVKQLNSGQARGLTTLFCSRLPLVRVGAGIPRICMYSLHCHGTQLVPSDVGPTLGGVSEDNLQNFCYDLITEVLSVRT